MTGRVRVSSSGHPVVKLARALGRAHGRKKHGLVLLEGLRAAEAALKTGVGVKAALFASAALASGRAEVLLRRLKEAGVAAYEMPDALYRTVSLVESPQGVALVCAPPRGDLSAALEGDLVVIADRLQDPGNLGSLLRAARGFGVDAVVTTAGTVEAANPKAVRAAAGAWPGLALVEGIPPGRLRQELAREKFRLLVSDPRAGRDYREPVWRGRVALVLGSEAHGAGAEWDGGPRERVRIPLHDSVESLNVSSAAAVLLAEAFRQRRAAGPGHSRR